MLFVAMALAFTVEQPEMGREPCALPNGEPRVIWKMFPPLMSTMYSFAAGVFA